MRLGGSLRCRFRKRKDGQTYRKRLKADPDRFREFEAKRKARYESEAHYLRWKAYRQIDRNSYEGMGETLDWLKASELMSQPCMYCGLENSGGLDRRDNDRAHAEDNVVPCCANCNLILNDMPPTLKDIMASSLREAREKGLFEQWTHPRLRHLK